ncbi:hypothetical protein [Arthrobacter sp. H5]|uniref:hypothetical protein n=1 Tax=Arthrobacter sp. H5 TaxID=1267973 RepID=UPI000688250A|nr:hypothetical protein [Arthrobacter sp. H5]
MRKRYIMAERGNTTHGARLDDKMKQETGGMLKGNHPSRAEEWREPETMDDGADLTPDAEPEFDPGIDPGKGIDEGNRDGGTQ